jgi:hypothetical protein
MKDINDKHFVAALLQKFSADLEKLAKKVPKDKAKEVLS